MPSYLGANFIELSWITAIQIIILGFIGGVLSGFIGSGGAFFMTPGMMNIGVAGNIAVASNITHKFGKAMVGARRHSEVGHVDKRLAMLMLVTAAAGISLAAWLMNLVGVHGGEAASHSAAADLYISIVFIVVLSFVSVSMLRDIMRSRNTSDAKPSAKIVDMLNRLRIAPMINFPVADVSVSLWVILIGGLAVGYLAGTIGVGGFIGVPVMIYVFGISAQVAAGTELYLAQFMGAWGALTYGIQGMVDLRLVALLYIGSLIGIHLGAHGTRVVKEVVIRLVTAVVILLCVVSRAINVPVYLRELNVVSYDTGLDQYLTLASKGMLYMSGLGGILVILYFVFKACSRRRKVRATLVATRVEVRPT